MTEQKLYCSFCGKHQDEVTAIVQWPSVNICDICVRNCVETLESNGFWPVATPDRLRRGLMALAAYIGPNCTAAVNVAMGDAQADKEPSQ